MIVLRIAVVVFINSSAAEIHLVQQPGIDHLFERSVNRCTADIASLWILLEIEEQLVRVEMLVTAGNLLDNYPALLCDPLSLGLQKLLKPLERREGDFDGAKGKIVGHGSSDSGLKFETSDFH
jgi:hypothetical protein